MLRLLPLVLGFSGSLGFLAASGAIAQVNPHPGILGQDRNPLALPGNPIDPAAIDSVALGTLALDPSPLPPVLAQASPPPMVSTLSQDVLAAMNEARTNPQAYATIVQAWKDRFQGDGKTVVMENGARLMTFEGVAAVDETIAFLQKAQPLSPLSASPGLALAAQDHVEAQGPTGATGHDGARGGMQERIERHGRWQVTIGENISYGATTGQQVVTQLLIDDGVPNRGHRANIFNPKFQVTGIACGPHANYRTMCVITYAGGFEAQEAATPTAPQPTASPVPAAATTQTLTIRHGGTVPLTSIQLNGQEILVGGALAPGSQGTLSLGTCEGDLLLKLEGFAPVPWRNLDLCRFKTLIIDSNNSLRLSS